MVRKLRFVANSTMVSALITPSRLAAAAGLIATGATTSVHMCYAVRMREVSIWAYAGPVGSSAVTATLDWNSTSGAGNIFAPGNAVSDTSFSSAVPAHVHSSPPEGSNASFWHTPMDTTTLITLSGPAQSIIDVVIEYVINDANTVISGPTIAGASTGQIYHRDLVSDARVTGGLNPIA